MPTVISRPVNAIARTALGPLPLDFWQRLFPKDVIALCYHAVSDERLPHVRLYPYKNARQFEEDLTFVRERTVSYQQVVDHRLRGASLPTNSVLITFDDGFAECYDVARPILLRLGIDAVFFVTTEFLDGKKPFFECTISLCVDRIERLLTEQAADVIRAIGFDHEAFRPSDRRYRRGLERLREAQMHVKLDNPKGLLLIWLMGAEATDEQDLARLCNILDIDLATLTQRRPIFMNSAQVRQLVSDGFTIGAHGLDHHLLDGRDVAAAEAEIVASCQAVRELTGQARVPFAFPYSGLAIDRASLAGILERNEIVEMIFDSGGLRRDESFVVNRVFTDAPPSKTNTNIPEALRGAWSIPSAWSR
jgi:peptidoglycan/xylan/chitin deacetylase (PgdA/CDA1 family)